MYRKLILRLYWIFLMIPFTLLFNSCDSLVPSDYKSQDYPPNATDVKAASILSRYVIDSLGRSVDTACYVVQARAVWVRSFPLRSLVDSTSRANNTDNQLIVSKFNSLVDSLKVKPLKRDTITVVKIDTVSNTAYAYMEVTAGQSNNIYIYTSMQYTEKNIQHYVSVQLVKSDSSTVGYSDIMLAEDSYAITTNVKISGGQKIVPIIRSRNKLSVGVGKYLVRFTMSEAVSIKLFKFLILSI